MTVPTMLHRIAAELFGTFWLVLGGCGSAVFAAAFVSADAVSLGIGFLGVALAFGLTVLTAVYAFGTVSGGHFNPAVTLGAAIAGRVEWKAVVPYWLAQVVGGLLGGLTIFVIAKGKPDFDPVGNMAANGIGGRRDFAGRRLPKLHPSHRAWRSDDRTNHRHHGECRDHERRRRRRHRHPERQRHQHQRRPGRRQRRAHPRRGWFHLHRL